MHSHIYGTRLTPLSSFQSKLTTTLEAFSQQLAFTVFNTHVLPCYIHVLALPVKACLWPESSVACLFWVGVWWQDESSSLPLRSCTELYLPVQIFTRSFPEFLWLSFSCCPVTSQVIQYWAALPHGCWLVHLIIWTLKLRNIFLAGPRWTMDRPNLVIFILAYSIWLLIAIAVSVLPLFHCNTQRVFP